MGVDVTVDTGVGCDDVACGLESAAIDLAYAVEQLRRAATSLRSGDHKHATDHLGRAFDGIDRGLQGLEACDGE